MAVRFFFITEKKGERLLFSLKPNKRFDRVTEITAEDIKSFGANTVLLDADNTLSLHGSQNPAEGVPEWINKMRESGIKLIIISNNDKERIKPFAEKLGLPFVYKSKKPLKHGFKLGCEKLGSSAEKSVVIGDQLFTDILGGNLFGATTFLTEPLGEDTHPFIKFKRKIERFFR